MLLLVNLSSTMSSWNRGTLTMLLPVYLNLWTMSHQPNAFNLHYWRIRIFDMKVTKLAQYKLQNVGKISEDLCAYLIFWHYLYTL